MTSSISSQEFAKRNQLHQKHQIAQEIAATEEAIRHLEFGINALLTEEKRHLKRLEALRGRGGT